MLHGRWPRGQKPKEHQDRLSSIPVVDQLLFEVGPPGARVPIAIGDVHGKQYVSQERAGEAVAPEIAALELGRRLEPSPVRCIARQEESVLADAESAGEFL